ncbi:MAG: hypoxanthine phosphoribosyltransferase [Spirochaetota bacterium]|nr:hypoxanthine phosphoribosyltransferase [Spirochaetota bacterium]
MKKLEVLFTQEQIAQRVKEIAQNINDYIGDDEAVIIANLKGAIPFYADIFRCLTGKVRMDFIETQSYIDNISSGHVKITRDLSENIEGKKIVIIEDILDTGLTFEHILKHIKNFHNPMSCKIAVLLNKIENRRVDIKADWIGFDIPNHFVIGYGLDDNQYLRNLPYIGYWV